MRLFEHYLHRSSFFSEAMTPDAKEIVAADLVKRLRQDHQYFVNLRRDIHRNPELGFEERRTSDIVANALTEWGYQVERGIGITGVVGQLRRGRGSRRLGIRADM